MLQSNEIKKESRQEKDKLIISKKLIIKEHGEREFRKSDSIVNLSSVELNEDELNILKRELNFTITL